MEIKGKMENKKQQEEVGKKPPTYQHRDFVIRQSVSGLSAAFVTTLALHPIDLVKIRLQLDEGKIRLGKVASIVREVREQSKGHVIKGLYRGVGANLMGNCVSWGLYFAWYGYIKGQMVGAGNKVTDQHGASLLTTKQHLAASALAGALTQVVANPIWIVKVRICSNLDAQYGYRGVIDGLVKIWKNEGGLRGYYRGLPAGIVGCSHGAVHFAVYEKLKAKYSRKFTVVEYMTMSMISKIVATVATYPYQVVRSRVQSASGGVKGYNNSVDVIREVYKKEKLRGFYKGMFANIVRVLPGSVMTFLIYEKVNYWMAKSEY